MVWSPEVRRLADEAGAIDTFVVGHPLIDDFLAFASTRARPNTVRAYAFDLKAFFTTINKDPRQVRPADVFEFIKSQQHARPGAQNVVRISDGGSGLSAATVKRRLAAVSSFYGYLLTRGDAGIAINPVPRGLPTRRARRNGKGQPLIRGVRQLPRILDPEQVAALMAALRKERDKATVQAMVLGGPRRCEVLGLRLGDLRLGEWRVFVAEGKGGHQRLVPMSPSFFVTVANDTENERPAGLDTDRLFVVLKGPRRGQPLSIEGLDERRLSEYRRVRAPWIARRVSPEPGTDDRGDLGKDQERSLHDRRAHRSLLRSAAPSRRSHGPRQHRQGPGGPDSGGRLRARRVPYVWRGATPASGAQPPVALGSSPSVGTSRNLRLPSQRLAASGERHLWAMSTRVPCWAIGIVDNRPREILGWSSRYGPCGPT